jgi:Uma2 family endonuclease
MRDESSVLEKTTLSFEELVLTLGTLHSERPLSKAEFVLLAERFPELRIERESTGKITVMPPVKKGTGKRESTLHGLLFMWNYQTKAGELYSSSTGFDLPDGSTKSPDVAWISAERAASANPEEEEEFVAIVPDFVAEIRSSTDRLIKLQKKMANIWMKNGVRLGWLIDPYKEQVFIYRQGQTMEDVQGFSEKILSGEDILPGFQLKLEELKIKNG